MKPTLGLLTGWAHGIESLRPLAERLATGFDVHLFTGAEILETARMPNLDVLIGWSMGGMLALQSPPARCKRLVLISSTARFCATEGYSCGNPEKVLRRMKIQLKRNPEAVLAEFRNNVHAPHPPPAAPSDPGDHLAQGLEYLLTTDLRDSLSDLQFPVLLLHGRQDRIIPPSASEWLSRHLPNARLIEFDDMGHMPDTDTVYPPIHSFLIQEVP